MAQIFLDDSKLVSMANVLREATETTEPLIFPEGFNAAISSLTNGVKLPELDNPATETEVFEGYEIVDQNGETKIGTFTIQSELTEQEQIISALTTILENKVSGKTGIDCELTITTSPGATVTATLGSDSVSAVAGNNGTATLILEKEGVWTITATLGNLVVSRAFDATYNASLVLLYVDPILENNSWEIISKVAQTGEAANYWSVGDTKAVLVKGTYGYFSLNETDYAYILGINHNQSIEGNGIHFSFKGSTGKDIAYYTFSMYDSAGTSSNNNWGASLMRTAYCEMFPSFFPTDLQAVLSPCTKYTDNTGSYTNDANYVTATNDKIFLLSEWEVFGARTYANSAEQNYQQQYDYYKAGNSKIRYYNTNQGTAYDWWTRSCSKSASTCFAVCGSGGTVTHKNATDSIGFVPCFKVG